MRVASSVRNIFDLALEHAKEIGEEAKGYEIKKKK